MNPSQHGAVAEAAIAFEAARHGITVLKPLFEGGRYDLVFDLGGRLARIRCKLAHVRGAVVDIKARTCRRVAGGGYKRATYSADEVDAVAAYCPEIARSYLVPIGVFPKSGCCICASRPRRTTSSLG